MKQREIEYALALGASLTGANLEQGNLSQVTIRDTDCSRANLRNSVWLGVSPAEGFRAEGADWTNAAVSRELAGQVGLAVTRLESHPAALLFEPEWWRKIEQICRREAKRVGWLSNGEIDAEDLVSDVGLHLLEKSPEINLNEPSSVLSYVRSLCRNLIKSNWKSAFLECELNWSLDELPDPRELNQNQSVMERVWQMQMDVTQLLDELPKREHDILVLRYQDGCSSTEVAKALGISVVTVSRATARAIDKMRASAERKGFVG